MGFIASEDARVSYRGRGCWSLEGIRLCRKKVKGVNNKWEDDKAGEIGERWGEKLSPQQ